MNRIFPIGDEEEKSVPLIGKGVRKDGASNRGVNNEELKILESIEKVEPVPGYPKDRAKMLGVNRKRNISLRLKEGKNRKINNDKK